jgi:transposase InsO family protein
MRRESLLCCVGWCLSRTIDTRLTLTALERAVATRQPSRGLIHHADRGVQYASREYVARLTAVGARISMAATGNPYENAKAESFFKTLKCEEVYLQHYRTFAEAEASIARFIDDVYNTKRLHSSLGYLPPVEFEAPAESDRDVRSRENTSGFEAAIGSCVASGANRRAAPGNGGQHG